MKIHQLKIDFNVTPQIARYVYVYIIEATNLYMIDSGVAGSETKIESFLKTIGRTKDDIKSILLTHAHPDHIGTAAYFRSTTRCKIYASKQEAPWIENIDLQYAQRPIPNYYALAGKSTPVDEIVKDGDCILLEEDLLLRVVSTPGHSVDEVSYIIGENAFIGDSIPVKGDIPIYVSKEQSVSTIHKLQILEGVNTFYPAWDKKYSKEEVIGKCNEALNLIEQIDMAVKSVENYSSLEDLSRNVCEQLGTPMLMSNPLFIRTIKCHTCTLRTFVYEDASTILGWCKTKHEFRLWSADRYKSFPASADEMMMQYNGCNMFPLTMVEGGRTVGHILLRYPPSDNDVIRFGFVIINDTLRGKGYGKRLLQLAIDYARDILHAKRITLGVFCDNLPALECYKSVGFTVIGNDSYMIDGEEWQGYEMEVVVN